MATPEPDWEAEGLLAGLDEPARAARVTLLGELHAEGTRLDELRAAVAEGRLAALPAEHVLGGPIRHSARDGATRNGLPVEFVLGVRRANGIPVADPDAIELSDADIELGEATRVAVERGITPEQVEVTARVIGHALRQLAAQLGSLVAERAADPALDELQLAHRLAREVRAFQPLVDDVVRGALRVHFREAIRDAGPGLDPTAAAAPGPPGAREVTVAFADLVGFTRMGEELPPGELEQVAQRLAQLAAEAADPPVRFVKTIGDAVMLVSPDAAPLVKAAVRLVALADAEGPEFPLIRVGVAAGPAVTRSGDWYGRPVNLASRLTGLARAHSVLVSGDVREAIGDEAGLRFSDAGVRRIRGIPHSVATFRARRV
ncbi:MAG: adenylate/guanylate cyclase domain-containing protein [Solirubrobacteraceae bacterium]|jgi:adenylate cyclase|nr:adenylate/guanylate cyclase domain-containing protein [Solirubrobacteraceae bacterium]